MGIDLVQYGLVENELYESGKISWIVVLHTQWVGEFENYCKFELLELRIGETPDDFYIEFEDLYVSTPLAAEFWCWVEGITNEYDEYDELPPIPGSWQDGD